LRRPDHRIAGDQLGLAAQTAPLQRAHGQQKGTAVAKADDLSRDTALAAPDHLAARANRQGSIEARDPPIETMTGQTLVILVNGADEGSHTPVCL